MRAQIRHLVGAVAGFAHLVLHRVYLLHRGAARLAAGCLADHKIWEVSAKDATLGKATPQEAKQSDTSCFSLTMVSAVTKSLPAENDAFC